MSGPLWAQVLVFYAVAIPVVAFMTHAVAWLAMQVTGGLGWATWLRVRLTGAPMPYANVEEWKADLTGGVPLDDILARARSGVPGRDVPKKKKEPEMSTEDFIKMIQATVLAICPSSASKILDIPKVRNADGAHVIGRTFRRKDTGRVIILKQPGDGSGIFDDGCRHFYADLLVAVPQKYEFWERLVCQKHGCMAATGKVPLHEHTQMKEWWYDPARVNDVLCGCLRFCGRIEEPIEK